jgi:hypothetical protein
MDQNIGDFACPVTPFFVQTSPHPPLSYCEKIVKERDLVQWEKNKTTLVTFGVVGVLKSEKN